MKLWHYVALFAVAAEAQEFGDEKGRKPVRGKNKGKNKGKGKGKRKPAKREESTTSTTTTTTSTTTTTFTTLRPLSTFESSLAGVYTDADGNAVEIIVNPDRSIIVLVKNSAGAIMGFDSITITNEAAGLINVGKSGAAVFDAANGIITFDSGMMPWTKDGATTPAAAVAATTPATTASSIQIEVNFFTTCLGRYTDASGHIIKIFDPNQTTTTSATRTQSANVEIRNANKQLVGFDTMTFDSNVIQMFTADQAQTTRVTFTTAGGASIGWATDSAGAPLTLPTITFDNGLASWVMEKAAPAEPTATTTTEATTTTQTTTTHSTTTFSTLTTPKQLIVEVLGSYSDDEGNSITITRNPDGSIKVVIKDVTGIIIGEDVGTIVDEAAGIFEFQIAGRSTFSNGEFTFDSGLNTWRDTSTTTTGAVVATQSTDAATAATVAPTAVVSSVTDSTAASAATAATVATGSVATAAAGSGTSTDTTASTTTTTTTVDGSIGSSAASAGTDSSQTPTGSLTSGVAPASTGDTYYYDAGTSSSSTSTGTSSTSTGTSSTSTGTSSTSSTSMADLYGSSSDTSSVSMTDLYGSSTGTSTGTSSTGTSTSTSTGTSTSTSTGTSTDTSTYSHSSTGTTGTGVVKGDPHVRIEGPNEEPICYEVSAEYMDFVSLIDDEGIGLEINGKIEHVAHDKNRLAEVGFQTKDGNQIRITDREIIIGSNGVARETYNFLDYNVIKLSDVELTIRSPHGHKAVIIDLYTGAQFMVSAKNNKDSMKLAIVSEHGLSDAVGGIMGQSVRPKEYHMSGQSILVEGRVIENTVYDTKNSCYRIDPFDLATFLGHPETEYAVDGLFSGIERPWFRASLQAKLVDSNAVPK